MVPARRPVFTSSLNVCEWDLDIEFADWTELPEYPLVTLRGLLGYALKELLHPGVTNPPPDSMFWEVFKSADGSPHPVLFNAAPGAGLAVVLRVRLSAFGPIADAESIGHLCIEALTHYGPRGFGPARMPYAVQACAAPARVMPWSREWKPSGAGQFDLVLQTPAQLKWNNQPADESTPLPEIIAKGGLRRLRLLAERSGAAWEQDTEAVDAAIACTRVTRSALYRVADERTSTQDGDSVALGGLVGRFELEGCDELERLFRIASIVGVGKHTSQGNGRVRLVSRHPSE